MIAGVSNRAVGQNGVVSGKEESQDYVMANNYTDNHLSHGVSLREVQLYALHEGSPLHVQKPTTS